MNAYRSERERISWHESGHACIGHLLGHEVASVSRLPGLTTLAAAPEPADALLFQLSGPEAEWLAVGSNKSQHEGSSDWVNADREAWSLTGDIDAMDALVARTRKAVRYMLLRNWSTVKVVAQALLDSPGRLTGDDITRLLSPCSPAGGPFSPFNCWPETAREVGTSNGGGPCLPGLLLQSGGVT